MKLVRYLLPLLAAVGITTAAYAERMDYDYDHQNLTRYQQELNERDFDALRQFVNSKRTLDIQDKSCNLTLSGDMRAEWLHLTEKRLGKIVRGGKAHDRPKDCDGIPLSRNDFRIAFGLRADYIADNAWGVAHLLFDNAAGVDVGLPCRCGKYKQCRDYHKQRHSENGHGNHQGHDKHHTNNETCDICCVDNGHHEDKHHEEKHHDGDHHDGKHHDGDHHDGKHDDKHHDKDHHGSDCDHQRCDPRGWHGSGTRNQINLRKAYLGYNVYSEDCMRFDVEIGRRNLYNIFDSKIQFLSRFDGLLLKYSDCGGTCVGDWYVNLGGFVIDERVNHFGWVTEVGFLNVCDMCLDLKYSYIDWNKHGRNRCDVYNPAGFKFRNSQFTAAYHLVPEWIDMQTKVYGAVVFNHCARKGYDTNYKPKRLGWYIGTTIGQVCEAGDWSLDIQYQYVEANAIPDRDVSGIGRGNALNESFTATARGNTNYKGWSAEFLYALTDNLTLDALFQHSNAIDKNIGGQHSYSKFKTEFVYAF